MMSPRLAFATFLLLLSACAATAWAEPKPPHVLQWGTKDFTKVPGGGAGELFHDPAESTEQNTQKFSYVSRGEGKTRGVDVFRDLVHQLPNQPAKKLYAGYVIGASTIHLASDRIVLTFHAANPERAQLSADGQRPNIGLNDVRIMYSDDDGASWKLSESRLTAPSAPSGTNYGAVEPTVFPLLDGRLWMVIRTQASRLYESYSADRGETWTEPVATGFISSDSPARAVRLSDQRIMLFFNSCQTWDDPHGYAHGGRHVLHAAVSSDDGRSWSGFREVVRARKSSYAKGDHGTGYPRAAATKVGKVLVGTGQAEENLAVIEVDPDWLEEPRSSDDFSKGLDAWHATADSVTMVEGDARGLGFKAAPAEQIAEAVWNFPAGTTGTLVLDVTTTPAWNAGAIMLTDHFSPPGDKKAIDHALWSLKLPAPAAPLAANKREKMQIDWDMATGKCSLTVNGVKTEFAQGRLESVGASYLRIRSSATGDKPGLIIHSASVEVNPPGATSKPGSN